MAVSRAQGQDAAGVPGGNYCEELTDSRLIWEMCVLFLIIGGNKLFMVRCMYCTGLLFLEV